MNSGIINPATIYIVFSHCVPVRCKAAKYRCRHSTASFANAVSAPARNGLSFDFNLSWTSCLHWHGVAGLANGITMARAPRLVPAQA